MSSPPRSRRDSGTWTALLVWTLVVCPIAAWLFWQRVVESDALFFILPGLLAAVEASSHADPSHNGAFQ